MIPDKKRLQNNLLRFISCVLVVFTVVCTAFITHASETVVYDAGERITDNGVTINLPVTAYGRDCDADLYSDTGEILRAIRLTDNRTTEIPVTVEKYETKEFVLKLSPEYQDLPQYDRTVYTIRISVVNNTEKGYEYAITAVKNTSEQKTSELIFRNEPEKRDPEPCSHDPGVQKIIKGNPQSDDIFTFRIEPVSPEFPFIQGVEENYKEITVRGAGVSEFGTIVFTEPGVYEYRITEKNTDNPNWIYDTAVYIVRYTVTENDGKLTASRVFLLNGSEVPGIERAVFTNTWNNDARNTENGKSVPGHTPKTGDENNLSLFILLMSGALIVIVILFAVTSHTENRR